MRYLTLILIGSDWALLRRQGVKTISSTLGQVRLRLDHPGQELWTWAHNSLSIRNRSNLDVVFVRRADIDALSDVPLVRAF